MSGGALHIPTSSGLALRTGARPGAPRWEGVSGSHPTGSAQWERSLHWERHVVALGTPGAK